MTLRKWAKAVFLAAAVATLLGAVPALAGGGTVIRSGEYDFGWRCVGLAESRISTQHCSNDSAAQKGLLSGGTTSNSVTGVFYEVPASGRLTVYSDIEMADPVETNGSPICTHLISSTDHILATNCSSIYGTPTAAIVSAGTIRIVTQMYGRSVLELATIKELRIQFEQ